MQAANAPEMTSQGSAAHSKATPSTHSAKCKVIRRNGQVTDFDGGKIQLAMTKAFLDVEGNQASGSARIHDAVHKLTEQVIDALLRRTPENGTMHIEDIQDQVELALMRAGEHKVARCYVLYREQRARLRAEKDAKSGKKKGKKAEHHIQVKTAAGDLKPLDEARLRKIVAESVAGLAGVNAEQVLTAAMRNLYDGIPEKEVATALIISTRVLIDRDPNYSQVTARMLMDSLRREALSFLEGQTTEATQVEMATLYPEMLAKTIKRAVEVERLADELARYDLAKLGAAIKPERDLQFTYLGLQTLYDRYFLHHDGVRFELPQIFFMRVAMGLAINEVEREDRAIEFYNLLSSFDFMSSTPTLFNSGTLRPQLSSCYLTTVPDHLEGIYDAIKDNALLSKYAGGLGNDWSRVRGMGAHIKGTNGKSQGVVPFLKVANDTAVAVNQCFAPDTYLHMAEGIKAIREVKAGDLVLGISGTYREVKRAMIYNQHDAMVAVDVKHAIEPVKVTAGHPFYALRGVPMAQANERTHQWLAKGKVQPEWVDAGQLQKGDYIAQVIPTETVMVNGFTADDARLYGILLGDGHLSKNGMEWGVSGNPQRDVHLSFVRNYLAERGIHSWETGRGETYMQIRWASGQGAVRDGTTGRIVGAGAATLPFTYDDLYNAQGEKRIARRFNHLPHAQTLALLQGLLETDGGVSRGKEIYFTSTSRQLAEGVRYQCLRLGVPTAGQYRERDNAHTGTRSDGSSIRFDGVTKAFDVRIPAVPAIAALVDCQPIEKHNWLTYNGCVFSRVRSVESIPTLPFVFDLIVEGDESYMTTAGLAHNGGKRKGAVCAYLETWHIDIEDFLELRKNTGDERRRTHDMNTANWIPDLFMKRVAEEAEWTLFSPDDASDLHELTGKAFEARYTEYEAKAARGDVKLFRKVPALQLWRKMLGMLFETGHPWITFKDPCNVRYTNQHMGVVHSSNLCCMTADQRVVTDRGLLTVGELYRLGGSNQVVGLDGVYHASEMLLPRPNAPIVRIETSEGYEHKVTPDHKVWVKDRGWVEAQHLVVGDKLLTQQLEGLWGKQHNPELSYLMGLIAGDGTFGEHNVFIDVWEQDFACLEETTRTVHQLLSGNTVLKTTSVNTPVFRIDAKLGKARLASAPLRRLLAEQGFTPETKTHVPELVWRGDRETVSAYLKGLYQADGNVVSSHDVTTLALASTHLDFIRDLQILWANFGVKSSINQMRGHELKDMPDGRGGQKAYWSKPLYRLLITSIQGCQIAEAVTQLATMRPSDAAKRYLENLQKAGYQQKLYATFTGLTPLPNEDAYCLSVDSDTHAWTVNGMITKNTEITLHTNDSEIAVCNLGSVNLPAHVVDGKLDVAKLERTVTTAMRMLDNVIDYNYYSVPQARKSNLRHRPVGLGIMGFQDALYKMDMAYASADAVTFADQSMEAVSYFAIRASSDLASERGRYPSYNGSLWSKGILPIDSLELLGAERGEYFVVDHTQTLDWDALRNKVKQYGMRNSNVMAIAPTATISNICGVSQSIEPTYQNLFVKSNLSGEFTVINPYLVEDLKALGLWDEVMINDLKYFDGSVQPLERVPDAIKAKYATAFEIDARWLVEAASRRQKWIDQGQSLNLYLKEPNGAKLDNLYKLAWVRGLKTTYYLRTLGATGAEKTSSEDSSTSNVSKPALKVASNLVSVGSEAPKACSLLDPDCEACQ